MRREGGSRPKVGDVWFWGDDGWDLVLACLGREMYKVARSSKALAGVIVRVTRRNLEKGATRA